MIPSFVLSWAKQTAYLAGLLLCGTQCLADQVKAFQPVFYVEDEGLAGFSSAIGYTYALRNLEAFFLQDANKANFVFVSISGLIKDKKIDPRLLDMFSEGVRNDITAFPSDSDECFVQSFTTSAGRTFVLGLNEPNNGPLDTDKKCFLLTLAFFDDFSFASKESFDTDSIAELTSTILNRLREPN